MIFNPIYLDAAEAATESAANAASGGGFMSMLPMLAIYALIFGAMWFFLIRPQKKKQKEEKKMRENLQIGDEIVTIGGVYGRVVALKEDTIVIESQSDHSKLTFARWALQQNLTVHDDAAAK